MKRTDFIVDRRGWDAAEGFSPRHHVRDLLATSPRRIRQASDVTLLVDGDGTTFQVRAVLTEGL